jgi:serine/threonine protein kinase
VLKTFKRSSNIIEVFDILTTKNNTYIITELCEGGDLSKFIAAKRGLPEAEAINILRQIVDGYSEISSNRIIHRDLKPANILLKDNKIKIADFGFAMRASDSRKYSSYNVGSPIYMPPEALNDNKYSYKSDIWAIGVIFFELLTGRTPWKAKTEK